MKKIEDAEIMLYNSLAKARDGGVYDLLKNITNRSINLYMERFGDKEYAKSIPEQEFTEQLIDCINHLVATDNDTKKFFEVINEENDQNVIIASISAMMIG